MKRTFALGIAGALVAGAALFVAPQSAQAQVGISVGFGSGYGYGYNTGVFGVGSGLGYFDDDEFFDAGDYVAPVYYRPAPVYRTVRVVRQAPRVAVPVYYAPRQVVRTRVVTRAPRVVTTRVVTRAPRVVTRNVVTSTSYGAPEIRNGLRTRVIDRNPTRRVYY